MANSNKESTELVNRSGFLFQLAIEHAINSSFKDEGINVLASEHLWVDPRSGERGFIDLVVEGGFLRIVIECKRPKGGKWFFLVPKSSPDRNPKARVVWQSKRRDGKEVIGVDDLLLAPYCHQSSICIIRASGEDETTLLERYASRLLSSVEALALEEVGLPVTFGFKGFVYIPLIVTSASLYIARVDPDLISLTDGIIQELDFQEVPHVKFRKSLVSELSPSASPRDLTTSSKDKERTVLVVKSEHLIETINNLQVRPNSALFPWDQIDLQK